MTSIRFLIAPGSAIQFATIARPCGRVEFNNIGSTHGNSDRPGYDKIGVLTKAYKQQAFIKGAKVGIESSKIPEK